MIETFTLYWIIGFAVPPILFLLWNQWTLKSKTKHIMSIWEEREIHWIRRWTPDTKETVKEEVEKHIGGNLQSPLLFMSVFGISLIGLPAVSYRYELGLYPVAAWLFTGLILYIALKKKAKVLEKEGIPFNQVATHKRIKEELRVSKEFKDGIVFPYLFLKSYQRALTIQVEISSVIRTAPNAREGKEQVHNLTLEEKELIKDMNNAVMGRVPKQLYEPWAHSKEDKISELLSTIENQSLPVNIRQEAMVLLSELEVNDYGQLNN